tara:strand:+ start:100 stop:438 length:339 start_codon:yes stop_codon:yes gene_type:complete
VFEIFGGFEKSAYFGLAQHYGQFILALYLRKLDMPIFNSQDLINGTKTENGVLKKTFGWALVQVLAMKKIIIDQLGRKCLRALFVMQGQMCQAPRVVFQGTLGLAIDRETLQ